MLYYVVAYEHLEHPTLILSMLYEDLCCIHYAFNINVNELECNGYFSTVWCSCAQITAMHNELWIKWASDVGQWFQKHYILLQASSVKLKVTIYLLFPSMAVISRLYDQVVVSEWCSQAAVSLRTAQQRSMFVWRGSHCSTAIYSTLIFYMPVVLSLGISSGLQTFFFTATSQPPLLWHFIYIPISCIHYLETCCTNKMRTAQTDRKGCSKHEIDIPLRHGVVSTNKFTAG